MEKNNQLVSTFSVPDYYKNHKILVITMTWKGGHGIFILTEEETEISKDLITNCP
jgi:hypothetical protein